MCVVRVDPRTWTEAITGSTCAPQFDRKWTWEIPPAAAAHCTAKVVDVHYTDPVWLVQELLLDTGNHTSDLLFEPASDSDRRGPEPNTGRYWAESHARMRAEDVARGDGVCRLMLVLGLYCDKTSLTDTVGTKPLGLTLLNLPTAGRNRDRGKRVICQIPDLPLTSKAASMQSKPTALQAAVRSCWHASVHAVLRAVRRAQRRGGVWLRVPTHPSNSW